MEQPMRMYRMLSVVASVFTLCTLSVPAMAGWSKSSASVFEGQTSYCRYRSSNLDNNRDARIQVQRYYIDFGDFGGFAVVDSVVRNVSAFGKADIAVVGWDNNIPPGSYLPYLVVFQNVNNKADRYLSAGMVAAGYAPTYKSFLQSGGGVFGFRTDINLQASCLVSNDG